MINAGIVGADTRMAGELLRILVNHPDVELVALCAPGKVGIRADAHHHGLTGECSLRFTDHIDASELDLVFIDAHSSLATHLRSGTEPAESMKIIDMSHGPVQNTIDDNVVYGLSELNRRKLANEAIRAVVPRSLAALTIVSLLPLGTNLLLPPSITAEVSLPEDLAVAEKIETSAAETGFWLSSIQSSFSGNVEFNVSEKLPASARGIRIRIRIPASTDIQLIRKMFDERLEDHHLAYVTDFNLNFNQVEGTDKILIGLSRDSAGILTVEAIADCRMRGGAGDAVHIMNLMFGLCESTGLRLKANAY